VLLGILAVVYFALFLFRANFPKTYFGLMGLPAVFLAGYLHVHFQKHTNQSDHLSFHRDSVQYYRAVITTFSQEKQKSWRTEALLTQVYSGGRWIPVKAKILFYFSKDGFENPFAYGDVLLIKGGPTVMTPPSNPGEFDYKRYLSFRNIYHQHFLKETDVRLIGHEPTSLFIKYALLSRNWCNGILQKYVTGERERAVASALVLGVTDGLDNELLNAYSATGAMHVLAVSGLHISILYMIIMWVLKPLLKLKSGPWLLALMSLILLWLYAFVTGLWSDNKHL
jgi:competence protein ComEC